MDDESLLERTREAWSGTPPDWVIVLCRACARTNQSKVATQLGVNAGYVSNALRGANREYLTTTEEAVRALLMRETVSCPVLGEETSLAACRNLRRGVEAGRRSPIQKQARAACPSCIHNIRRPKE